MPDEATTNDGSDGNTLFLKGVKAHAEHNLDAAIACYQEAISKAVASPEALLNSALVLLAQRKVSDALKRLCEAGEAIAASGVPEVTEEIEQALREQCEAIRAQLTSAAEPPGTADRWRWHTAWQQLERPWITVPAQTAEARANLLDSVRSALEAGHELLLKEAAGQARAERMRNERDNYNRLYEKAIKAVSGRMRGYSVVDREDAARELVDKLLKYIETSGTPLNSAGNPLQLSDPESEWPSSFPGFNFSQKAIDVARPHYRRRKRQSSIEDLRTPVHETKSSGSFASADEGIHQGDEVTCHLDWSSNIELLLGDASVNYKTNSLKELFSALREQLDDRLPHLPCCSNDCSRRWFNPFVRLRLDELATEGGAPAHWYTADHYLEPLMQYKQPPFSNAHALSQALFDRRKYMLERIPEDDPAIKVWLLFIIDLVRFAPGKIPN